MTQSYWERNRGGDYSKAGDNIFERFYYGIYQPIMLVLNDLFENAFGRFIHYFPSRNWFVSAPEGTWTGGMGDVDKWHVPLGGFLCMAFLLLSVGTNLQFQGLLYTVLLIGSMTAYSVNFIAILQKII